MLTDFRKSFTALYASIPTILNVSPSDWTTLQNFQIQNSTISVTAFTSSRSWKVKVTETFYGCGLPIDCSPSVSFFRLAIEESSAEAICFEVCRPAVVQDHARGHWWKGVQGHRLKVKVMYRLNAILAEECLSTVRRGVKDRFFLLTAKLRTARANFNATRLRLCVPLRWSNFGQATDVSKLDNLSKRQLIQQ